MPYVQRDDDGKIKGVYALLQQGYAEEYLEDDDPDLVEYLKRTVPSSEPRGS